MQTGMKAMIHSKNSENEKERLDYNKHYTKT